MSSQLQNKPSGQPASQHRTSAANRRRSARTSVVHERCKTFIYTEETLGAGDKPIEGVVTDVSLTGIRLCISDPVAPKKQVILELKSRRFEGKLQAEVVWCNKVPTTGNIIKPGTETGWRVGLKIILRTEEEKKFLQALISAL